MKKDKVNSISFLQCQKILLWKIVSVKIPSQVLVPTCDIVPTSLSFVEEDQAKFNK